ncbi:hypothetical protein AAFF_G00233310 [Aldrovandia affinis]|uniref:Somatostatin/Cortistatin C-terminal domain-containing protein n=1 Tax=Aldrovandia affinis TaxID=143900 RepID=A0AAD7RET5_9TELE|nr:hypothetical protein AAFF_G00233310 [Aldrovandia affinis]
MLTPMKIFTHTLPRVGMYIHPPIREKKDVGRRLLIGTRTCSTEAVRQSPSREGLYKRGAGCRSRLVRSSAESTMNLLMSFIPLVLIVWSGQHAGALPTEDRLTLLGNGGLAKQRRDFLLKMLSGLSDLNLLEKEEQDLDTEQLQQAKLGERSLLGPPVPRERSPCKNFFWKTFSSC